ncbi:MAG: TolC family protein [Paracoccaceae bacterium]|nr:TolC family protein [Paracoccaceae bacterium]
MKKFSKYLANLMTHLVIIGLSFPAASDTLDEILQLTYSSNRQLVLTRAHLASQRDAIKLAISDLGISVSTDFNGSRDWNLKLGSQADSFSASLIGRYTLSDGRRSKNKIALEEYTLVKAKHQLEDLEQKVLLETINTYLNILRDQKFVALSKGNVAVLQRQFEEIKDRFNLGEVTRTDVAQAESALASAKANLTAKKGALGVTSEIFLSQVGVVPNNLKPVVTPFKLPKNVELAKRRALRQHPKILSATTLEKMASILIDIQKGAKKPLFSLKSSLTNGFNQSSGNYNSASIKFEGSIPIFNAGRIDNAVSQAESNFKAEKANTELVRRSVLEEVSIAWTTLKVAEATIEARKRQIEASKIAYDGVLVEEKLGTRTTLNVINAEQDLLDARTQLASAERDHLYAMFAVLASSGDLNIKHLGISIPKSIKK